MTHVRHVEESTHRGRVWKRGRLLAALVGLAVSMNSFVAQGQRVVAAGANVWVSKPSEQLVLVEPVLTVDPRDANRMVAAAIALRRPYAQDWQDHQTIHLYYSDDAGKSWLKRPVASLPDTWTAGDPWLAWSDHGDLALSAIAGKAITRRVDPRARARLFVSRDRGRSWVGGDSPFAESSAEDHPVLIAAAISGKPVFYAVATNGTLQVNGIDVVHVAASDLKSTALPPLRPSVEQVNLGGAVVRAHGEIVVSFHSMSSPMGLWSARLDADATTWTVRRIQNAIVPVGFPSLAVDRSRGPYLDRVYAAWVDAQDDAGLRVVVSSSDDGLTWSRPIRVHADARPGTRTLPVIAVAPDGAVAVVWQDRRNAGGRECSDLYGSISTDGGASFLPEVRISSETSCPGVGHNGVAASRFRLGGGDYQGLMGVGPRAFQAIWCDSRSGRYQVWTARMEAQ